MKVLRFILNAVWPFRFYLIGPFLMMLIHSIDLSLRPYLTKLLIDTVSTKSGQAAISEMANISVLYIFVLFIVPIGWRIYDWSCLKYEPALKGRIAEIMMKHLTLQSHSYFSKHYAGSLANKVNDTIRFVPELVTLALNSFIMNFLSMFVAVYALWSIHIWFAFAMSSWAAIFTVMSLVAVRRFSNLATVTSEASSRVIGLIVDVLTNISTVRLFAARKNEISRLREVQNQYTKATAKKRMFSIKFYLLQGFIFALYQAISLLMLIFLFAKNQVTAGDFAMLLSINISVVTSLWHMSDDMKMFSENWGSVEQAIKILDTNISVQDAKDAKNLVVTEGKIEIKNLLFHHSGETPLFSNLNLTIEPGQKVGFVGYSGSGKTTLVNLILRLFEINKGTILIDGQNIKDISQESLRNAISVIPQDTSLFNRTILDNIKYGNIDSDDEDVIEAAKKASAHSFISSLPNGYYSQVGERALNISSGQRQRILIARALLKDSKIIIMDEATSNLDSITENFIEKKLKTILENKTSIIIAHRISTLQNMDRVIVFDKGQIVEDGSPQELFDKNGLFRKLCENEHDGIIQTKKIE